jgi:hypothetical protein
MTTTPAPRIREVYREYALGRIPFEAVVRAADEFLERFESRRRSDRPLLTAGSRGTGSRSSAPANP